jgi:hypothetical protein
MVSDKTVAEVKTATESRNVAQEALDALSPRERSIVVDWLKTTRSSYPTLSRSALRAELERERKRLDGLSETTGMLKTSLRFLEADLDRIKESQDQTDEEKSSLKLMLLDSAKETSDRLARNKAEIAEVSERINAIGAFVSRLH